MENVEPFVGIIAPYFNFVLFLILAVVFFKKPAKAAAEKKRQDFKLLLEEAQQAKRQAEERLAELNARLANLDQEVAEVKATAEASAKSQAEKLVADAERLATHLREEAKRIAAAEMDKARTELRREIVAGVRDAAFAKARQELDQAGHKSLVDKRIGSLAALRGEA